MREIHLSATGRGFGAVLDLRRLINERLETVRRGHVVELNELADALSEDADTGTAAWALAGALRALDRAQRWEAALADAEPSPERFRDSARFLAEQTANTTPLGAWSPGLRDGLQILASLGSFDEPERAAAALRRATLPIPMTTIFERPSGWTPRQQEPAANAPPVVHLRFDLDERAVAWPLAVEAGRAYRLGVTAHPDAWPVGADRLEIALEGVPSAVLSVDPITITSAQERAETYMVSNAEIDVSRPAELTAIARFTGADLDLRARVVGHRRLRVTTLDPGLATGQPFVAQKIVEMLGELGARIPTLPTQDRKDFVALLDATLAFASLAIERRDLEGIDERAFQQKLKQAFVHDQRIGRDIQEGTRLGGGVVDLVLRRINDELKVIHDAVDIGDAEELVGQPTQYGSGTDSPVSILTVLDDSPKDAPPGIPANYVRWVYPQLHGAARPAVPSMVAVVLVRVGFRRPSDWTDTPTQDPEERGDGTAPEVKPECRLHTQRTNTIAEGGSRGVRSLSDR